MPSRLKIFIAADAEIRSESTGFESLFFTEYPEYSEGRLVGYDGTTYLQLAHDRALILRCALGCLWDRCQTFACDEAAVERIVSEFAEFVDSPNIRVRFQAQLLNYRMHADTVNIGDMLTIRRLNDREITEFHGGSQTVGLSKRPSLDFGPIEFVIEGEVDVTKSFGGDLFRSKPLLEIAREQFDKAVLCLRTFKGGSVGYDWVHFNFLKFCPCTLPSYRAFGLGIHPGVYWISEQEINDLTNHAGQVFGLREAALEIACARLADAEARIRPQDQILDAVIGMEAVLLAALENEDRRSELKYRFSLNYSTLFSSPHERLEAFRTAKGFYDLRSRIAHGGERSKASKVPGDKKMSLNEAARLATEALRMLIKRFLPEANSPPYKRPTFWEHAYFGLVDSQDSF